MKTSKLFSALFMAVATIQGYSQNANEISIYYGISDSKLLRNEEIVGAGYHETSKLNEFGVKYLRHIKNNFSIELGMNILKADLAIHSAPTFPLIPVRYEKLEMISIPIAANYTLWRYLFVNAGPVLDFQTSENSIDSQSGIGYSIGFGGKYHFNNFLIYVNPNYKRHAVVPFEKEIYPEKLTEFGIQFGLGLKF